MESSLKDKNIVIVGGCGLIGRYFSELLLKYGSNILVIDSSAESVNKMKEDFKTFGQKARFFNFDVSQKQNWNNLFSEGKISHQIDGLVYCAAINPKIQSSKDWPNQLAELDEVEWNQAFQVGGLGILHSVLACLPAMQKAQGSSVVLMGSDLSFISPDNSLYCSCLTDGEIFTPHDCPTKPIQYSFIKSGLIGLTKNLATMLASSSVHVNIMCPGTIFEESMPESFVKKVSQKIPLGRPGQLSELEFPLLFLLNAHNSYMTGQYLIIDGGRTSL